MKPYRKPKSTRAGNTDYIADQRTPGISADDKSDFGRGAAGRETTYRKVPESAKNQVKETPIKVKGRVPKGF